MYVNATVHAIAEQYLSNPDASAISFTRAEIHERRFNIS